MLTFTPGLPAAAASLAGQVHDVLLADEKRDAHVRRCDVLVVPDIDSDAGRSAARTVHVSRGTHGRATGRPSTWASTPRCIAPSAADRRVRPQCARQRSPGSTVTITVPTARVAITGQGRCRQRPALRGMRAVVCDAVPPAVARQLKACGIVRDGDGDAARRRRPPRLAGWLGRRASPRAAAVRAVGGPRRMADRQRRPRDAPAGPSGARLAPAGATALPAAGGRRRRPRRPASTGRASGSWLRSCRTRSRSSRSTAQRTLGEALQACSDRAEGALVTKMDDDDVYGPEHVWDLVLARQYSGAQVVGKALDWIHLESQDITVFRPTTRPRSTPTSSPAARCSSPAADLAAVGGWRPVPKSRRPRAARPRARGRRAGLPHPRTRLRVRPPLGGAHRIGPRRALPDQDDGDVPGPRRPRGVRHAGDGGARHDARLAPGVDRHDGRQRGAAPRARGRAPAAAGLPGRARHRHRRRPVEGPHP